ncbi:MAG: class I SAM-dependent methyltransferase [Oscillospiraceae bacterium]|jgi:SAM-dependent methyltransferase|nr:class I SAM-dependent methyltransferase [Oscillospiraceae bacterium]
MPYSDFSNYYDCLMTDVDYELIARWIDRKLAGHTKVTNTVVDLACGTGTLSLRLKELGYDMICVDGSYDMLSKAREKLGGNTLLLCQKMQRLDLYGTADAVVCTLDSISHVTQTALVKEIFRRASLFLEDGGVLIFDVNTPYKHRNILSDNIFVMENDEVYCVWRNFPCDENGIVEISMDFFTESEGVYHRSTESFSERAYDIVTLSNMLKDAEFDVEGIFDGYTDNEINDTSQRAVFVAVRRKRKA